ncbi:hypothetical protein RRG08_020672 [Elysia crispata]|uniref:Uncharacterized protein n=1 Tax=Elysia crispata TaxID=231223 RepID=A0AAE0Z457_9GAST|nr:hypothetical protein RRG08_020672 [Elysia crispata]
MTHLLSKSNWMSPRWTMASVKFTIMEHYFRPESLGATPEPEPARLCKCACDGDLAWRHSRSFSSLLWRQLVMHHCLPVNGAPPLAWCSLWYGCHEGQ